MNILKKDDYFLRWEKRHSDIFIRLIDQLNNEKLRYFILRNFEGLPNKNSSKDIDIIIEPGSYNKAFKILYTILKEKNISFYNVVKYERVHCCFGIDPDENFSIHIDLIEGYLSKGFEVFAFDELYKNTLKYNEFIVLNNTYDAIMLLYYKVIGSKQLKEKYKERISTIYKKEKENIDGILKKTLNHSGSAFIINALENSDYKRITDNAHTISKVTKRKAFSRRPLSTFFTIVKFFGDKFHRIIICPRRFQNFIAVEGADGTGKSTFINGLVKAIAYYYVSEESKSHIYHHRPTLFPNLGTVGEKVGIMREDKDFINPHRAKPVGFVSSFIRMTYYWLDYAIGVPLMLRKDVQFDNFTIYDRYIYDFLIDPHRSRINLPYWLRKIYTKLVIQPRIVFVLLTDAEIIYKRKQELTIDEINRQLGEFSKLAKSNKRFVVIDASNSPEEMVEEAIKVVIEKFTKKIE